jgi:hypothetical protein
MSLVQLVAARAAGAERVVFYTVAASGQAEFDLAVAKMRRWAASPTVSAMELVEQVAGTGMKWGASDGS